MTESLTTKPTMKIFDNMKRDIFLMMTLAASLACVSCSEELVIGEYNETKYSNTTTVSPYIIDANTGKTSNIVELRADSYESSVVLGLSRLPKTGVDAVFTYDEADAAEYARKYNELHETDFEIYPAELVSFGENPKVLLAPDEQKSAEIPIHITYSPELEDDKTYILPVKATASAMGDVDMTDEAHGVYLVRNYRKHSNTFKGKDAVKTILFLEINDTNPLNALEYIVDNEESSLFFDYVVLFSANINYVNGRAFISQNPNIQFLLDNHERFIQPLRDRGIKVLMSILGNHDQSGVAQLSEIGAKDFAREIAAMCREYHLDGVSFDDEYSYTPDTSNPLFDHHSNAASARLCYETKMAMPEKEICIYVFNYMGRFAPVDGVDPGEFVDIVVPDYPATGAPEGYTMSNKSVALNSVQLLYLVTGEGYGGNPTLADKARREGYGFTMMFALYAGRTKNNGTYMLQQANICSSISFSLYDHRLKEVEWFYPKDSEVKVPMESMIW